MTIASENKKLLRRSMQVTCGVDTYSSQLTVTPSTRYGSGAYDENMRAGQRGITIRLMDLAGGGFPLDGTRQPIRSKAEADDGDATIVESYKGVTKYGIPATKASGSTGTTEAIGFTLGGIPDGAKILTAHLRDSEGETFRVTASSGPALQTAIRSVKITPGRRLYVDRITAGESWQWDKTNLISCNLALRGVETKGDNPELQMSEIEVKGIVPAAGISSISGMAENSPVWYVAGYHDDVTPVRRFYLSEGITTENIVATVKGYDATKFLEAEHHGVISRYENGFSRGRFLKAMARRCYGILGRGLIYDHNAEYARTPSNGIKGTATTDTEIRYMSANNVPRRSVVAAHCNLMRSASGGLDGSGVYCDYVDAGLPTFRAGTTPIGKTKFGSEWELDKGETSEFTEECEVAISKVTASVSWPKKETDTKGNVKYTSFYAETLSQNDVREIETEEPYGSVKFKAYDKVVKENASGSKEWIHSKIGNLYRINGHYYPDKENFGRSAFRFRIKALQTSKQKLVGVRNVLTHPGSLSGLPSGVSYDSESGDVVYKTGKSGEVVELPEVFFTTMPQAGTVNGTSAGSTKSMWGLFVKQIGDRSNIKYTFKYRGNPKMQPRDIIHMTIDGKPVDMTIDNLTLEHSEGGLISTIECRKGVI